MDENFVEARRRIKDDGTPDPTTHVLKCWTNFFEATLSGIKTFEIRVNDRDFRPGDFIILKDYGPFSGKYTGKSIMVEILYVQKGGLWGIPPMFVVMSTKIVETE